MKNNALHCSGDDKRCNTLQAVSNAARTRTFRDDGYAGYAGNTLGTLGTLGMLGTLRHMTIVALSCFCLRAIAACHGAILFCQKNSDNQNFLF